MGAIQHLHENIRKLKYPIIYLSYPKCRIAANSLHEIVKYITILAEKLKSFVQKYGLNGAVHQKNGFWLLQIGALCHLICKIKIIAFFLAV